MKLCNFASLDPTHRARGVRGLSHASHRDKELWEEFDSDWDGMTVESERLLASLVSQRRPQAKPGVSRPGPPHWELEVTSDLLSAPTESQRIAPLRLRQALFRRIVLASYRAKCCVCGNPVPALLVASHIIPWAQRANLRMNPHNGLCMCALHDRAFDCRLLAVSSDYSIRISDAVQAYLPSEALENGLTRYDGGSIDLPDKFLPSREFLAYRLTTPPSAKSRARSWSRI